MKLRATHALYNVMKLMMARKLEWEISKGAFPPHQIIRSNARGMADVLGF